MWQVLCYFVYKMEITVRLLGLHEINHRSWLLTEGKWQCSVGTQNNGLEIRRECGYREINKTGVHLKPWKLGERLGKEFKIRTTKMKTKL